MKAFSIVIPTYNDLSLLRRALNSVVRQEETDYEIIITDDSSDDIIEQYVRELGHPDIRYYRHHPGNGAADNWNYGLQKTTGQYVILMHHDEEIAQSDYLKCLRQQMDYGVDIVVSQVKVNINGQEKRQHYNRWLKEYICRHPACLFLLNVIGPCACLAFRKELLQPFNTDLRWLVDIEWYYRMLNGKKSICMHTLSVLSHHGHHNQISQTINIKKAFLSDKSVIRSIYQRNWTVRLMLFLYQHIILSMKG